MSTHDKVLQDLLTETVALLRKKIADGSATAGDLSVARALLRDNNIQSLPQATPGLLKMAESLPFATDDDK